MSETGFSDDFKRNFLTGLAALFPILVTMILFAWLYRQIDSTVGQAANGFFQELIVRNEQVFAAFFPGAGPEDARNLRQRRAYAQERFPPAVGVLLGLLVLAVLVYLLGKFLRGYIGGRLMRFVDRVFTRFPVIKAVYPHARNVADFVFGQRDRRGFSDVVAVQYPRKGIYSLGFVTSEGLEPVREKLDSELLTVFIPTSPTPLTGFVLLVPRDEIVSVEMTVDEAFRFFITAGMLTKNGAAAKAGAQAELPAGVPEGGD